MYFTNNSSYKIIRLIDSTEVKLTFNTHYTFEKRNFDIVNVTTASQIEKILLYHPDISMIVIQLEKDLQQQDFDILKKLPEYYKRRTFFYDTKEDYGIDVALKITQLELSNEMNPMFSFVTPLYKTNLEYFKETYLSLCSQTLNDWEWVLVDDSPEPLDYIKDFLNKQKDIRVRYYRIAPTNGNIGLSKWRGNCMSTGRWLIELDHDDMLCYWTLQTISEAINKYPDNKFIYSDNAALDENNKIVKNMYGDDYTWGLGYGYMYESKTPTDKTITTLAHGPINNACIRHIVGVPNHFRCWERDFYFSIGGHNQHLRIADDYELIVRSFLKTKFTHIMCCCYIQRFDGNNSQYKEYSDTDGQGNIADIQRRVRLISIYYDKQIHERLIELGLNDDEWIEGDPYETAHIYEELHLPIICEDQYQPFENNTYKPIKLGIFYLATGVYNEYFENFAKSLNNLFPDNNVEKHLILMSDKLKDYNGKEEFGCKIHCFDVIDYPYPLVLINKFQMVAKYMEDLDLDYGMFFDADTVIFEKSQDFWYTLKNKLMSGKLLVSVHPHYLYNPNLIIQEPLIVNREDSVGYTNSKVLNDNKSYLITSFFGGTKEVITKYAKKIYNLIGEDLYNIRWIPRFCEESYMNKIYVDDILLGKENDIIKEKYITINPYPFNFGDYISTGNLYENNFPEYNDTIFMNQKYNIEIKNKKKENKI